jgi:hypothetical protein
VGRVGRPGEIGLMARVAECWCAAGVARGGVTLRTRHVHMRAGQGEGGGRMVKGRGRPVRSRMTSHACCGEARGHVGRVGRAGKIGLVAGVAVRGQSGILAVAMTLAASQGHVSASQREGGSGVIVRGRCPIRGRVAGLAGGGKSCRHMSRIGRSGVIGLMARVALRRSAAGIAGGGVALGARQSHVASG